MAIPLIKLPKLSEAVKSVVRNERGYAIIEVIFLVAVIAILSSIILPQINRAYQIVYADHVMKNVYGGLRFIQGANRIAYFRKEGVLSIPKKGTSIYFNNYGKNLYKITIGDDITLYNYNLVPTFEFERKFYMIVNGDGILHDFDAPGRTSGHLTLKRNSSNLKPIIVFDSVGRIRLTRNFP